MSCGGDTQSQALSWLGFSADLALQFGDGELSEHGQLGEPGL